MWIRIGLAPWIRIRIGIDFLDPDLGELKLASKNEKKNAKFLFLEIFGTICYGLHPFI